MANPLDIASITAWWNLVYKPDSCVELRAIHPSSGAVSVGYYTTLETFLPAVIALDSVVHVYSTINPVTIDLMARYPNCQHGNWKAYKAGIATRETAQLAATSDEDIECERLVVLDIDPKRPSDVSSTDAEMQMALDVAAAYQADFASRGVESVIAMSGNGAYVIVPVPERPFDASAIVQRKALLDHLAPLHSTSAVQVDVKVANPSRIFKVLGTKAMKGAHSPETGRLHRQSRFVGANAPVLRESIYDVYRDEMVLDLVSAPVDPAVAESTTGLPESSPQGQVSRDYVGIAPDNRVDRARAYLGRRDGAVAGQSGHDRTFGVAMIVVEGFALSDADALTEMMRWNSKCEPPWSEREIAHKLRDAVDHIDQDKLGSRLSISAVAPERAGRPLRRVLTGLPVVAIAGRSRTLTDMSADLGALLDDVGTYYIRGDALQVHDANYVFSDLRPARLASELELVANLVKAMPDKDGAPQDPVPTTCSEQQAKLILNCAAFRRRIRPLRLVAPCPVIVERDGALVVITGYDRQTATLARGSAPAEMCLAEARTALFELLEGFLFLAPGDRSRAIAALITPALLFGGLLGGRAPIEVSEATESQTGKGYRHKGTAAVYGCTVDTITQVGGRGVGSLEESLDALLIRGSTFISVDNVRAKIDSPKLESCLSEDHHVARVPYSPPVTVDARRVVFMFTSNRAELTPDLAKRSSIVRMVKQPAGHVYRAYDEGDLLAHVRGNQEHYLGAVFAVIRAWYDAGKPRNPGQTHDFQAWASVLDWICVNLLAVGPLLDGHRDAQGRTANGALTWLRDVALAVDAAGQLGQILRVADIVTALETTGREIPGLEPGSGVASAPEMGRVSRATGLVLSRCFGQQASMNVDSWSVERLMVRDNVTRNVRPQYRVTRTGEGQP